MTTAISGGDGVAAVTAWTAAMRDGDFETAWRVADRLLEVHRRSGPPWHLPRHQQWLWDGRSLRGQRLLVHCYHGLGDTLQFARFLPPLAEMAAEVVVWVQPALVSLMRTLTTPLTLLPLDDGPPPVAHDVDIEITELAYALRVWSAELGGVPYLHVCAAPRPTERRGVGVVLQAGDWDARRSMPRAALGDLDPHITWYNLQLHAPLDGMLDFSTSDLKCLAERLKSLDLVISVDTMVAHLAGALGVPTWTLLPFDADWRWQRRRSDSPWYPTMRLLRQRSPGDWASVAAAIHSNLACWR